MDHSAAATDAPREEGIHVDKMRLDSFRLGRSPPASMNNLSGPRSGHARSHSRNGSVSVPLTFPTPLNSTSSVTTIDEPPASPVRNSVGAAKRNSHHRRRSSVSTRRESADMMGVTLPSITPSASEDNINLGEKDSIRRRALWTLEGKTDVGAFSKVEIPEFDSTESARQSFEFPSKPSYPPGVGAGLSSLIGAKRDSFNTKRDSLGKFMASASTKEQLHTLVEEEEEEEESVPLVQSPVEVTVTSPSPAPVRHRPASLNLRPLSLVSSNITGTANGDLPTPVLTPSPNPRPGLRSLTLASGTVDKRRSLILTQSPSPMSNTFTARPSLNLKTGPEAGFRHSFQQPSRRTSLPYVSSTDTPPQSVIGLPTPEMTPVTAERRSSGPGSTSSVSEDMEEFLAKGPSRPLSTSEQHFLFQAHATLVQRITDLERALSSRTSSSWSRPTSYASDVSSLSEPSDEMLQLIADLKAERDELKKDVDGWRVRVGDQERQLGVLAKRVEAERRDAWVARERVGLLEIEKGTLEKALSDMAAEVQEGQKQLEQARAGVEKAETECMKLKGEVERMQGIEEECVKLKVALEEERKRREELEKDLEHAGLLDTPRAFDSVVSPPLQAMSRTMMFAKSRGLGFQSMDSEGSFTDVESVTSPRDKLEFGLKAVAEEDEETLSNYSEEDELARFEDEEEGDEYAFPTSMSASSFGSAEDDTRSLPEVRTDIAEPAPPLTRSNTSSPSPLPSPVEQTHQRRASLVKAWTFPSGSEPVSSFGHVEEIDRFFGCLEDVDNSPPMHARVHSFDSAKNLFAQALMEDDDDLPPFVLPTDVGVEVMTPEIKEVAPKPVLGVVVEEDEEEEQEKAEEQANPDDEFVGEVYDGGIKFTFTVPPEYEESLQPSESTTDSPSTPENKISAAATGPLDEDEDSSFTFPHSRAQQNSPSPSSIPRLFSAKSSSIPVPSSNSTPVKSSSVLLARNNNIPSAFMTPPSKRGGQSPIFIPQPRTQTGSPFKTSSPLNGKAASFIPQPRRVSPPASSKTSNIPVMSPTTNASSSSPRSGHSVTSAPPPAASPTMNSHVPSDSDARSPDSQPSPQTSTSPSSFMSMSPTFAARLSFQTITSFIPLPGLPWSPRSSRAAAAAASALCFIPDSPSSSSSMGDISALEHGRSNSSFVNASVRPANTQPVAKERNYVPREKQLEKLRIRMENERRLRTSSAFNPGQGKSQGEALHL